MWSRLCAAAAGRKSAVAIGREDLFWTFEELIQRAEAVGRSLQALPEPPRIGVALPSGPEFTALQFGCLQAGALFVSLPDQVTVREARHYLESAAVDLLVAETPAAYQAAGAEPVVGFEALCEGRFEVEPDGSRADLGSDSRHLQFTTGTTGRPQGILLTESNLLANLQQSATFLESDRAVFCPSPQFHAMGGAVALENLCHGSAVLFANRFDPAVGLRRMEMCQRLVASPNFVRMLLRLGVLSAASLPNLEEITLGTAPVSRELVADLRAVFPEICIRLRYGLSESVGALTVLTLGPGELLVDDGDVGPPVDGVELDICDGELRVRAASVASRSISEAGLRPLLDADGFLPTGDEANFVGGHVHLGGRRSTFLKVHGHRVDPTEIESVLRELAGVAEVVVLGIPDEVAGERIVVCVERVGGEAVDEDELWDACRESLSPHKYPARIAAFESLPRTPSGKPDRAAIRAQLDSQAAD
ncbi:MAG: class I adenylate-forming enzyme family protein [Planctomycetota bacterium]|nr:class I adenylate-forming enzyme family protein [Planctomycetota bacterium]